MAHILRWAAILKIGDSVIALIAVDMVYLWLALLVVHKCLCNQPVNKTAASPVVLQYDKRISATIRAALKDLALKSHGPDVVPFVWAVYNPIQTSNPSEIADLIEPFIAAYWLPYFSLHQ